MAHEKGKADFPLGLVAAVECGQVGSCKQLSDISFPEMSHSFQEWGQNTDLAVRETEERAMVTAEEHAIYRAGTNLLHSCLLEFTLCSYLYVNVSVIIK